MQSLKDQARRLKQELHAIFLACRDARTPRAARWLALCVIIYAVSPIDLIPDPIPVLGYLDDIILLPLGIALVLKMIPDSVMADCREKAESEPFDLASHWKWTGAVLVVLVWLLLAWWIVSMFIGAGEPTLPLPQS